MTTPCLINMALTYRSVCQRTTDIDSSGSFSFFRNNRVSRYSLFTHFCPSSIRRKREGGKKATDGINKLCHRILPSSNSSSSWDIVSGKKSTRMLNPWHSVSNTFSFLYVCMYILVVFKDTSISISYKKEKWGLKCNLYEWILIISFKLKRRTKERARSMA